MKSSIIVFWSGMAIMFLSVAITGSSGFFGVVPGYILGFLLITWLIRDARLSVEMDMITAVKKMRQGLFGRLGAITLFMAVLNRFQAEWLPSFAVGMAIGVVLSFANIAKYFSSGKGG